MRTIHDLAGFDDEDTLGVLDWKDNPDRALREIDRLLKPFGLQVAMFETTNDHALRNPNGKMRPCMTCEKPFFSSGPGQRMCGRCKGGYGDNEGIAA